MDLISKIIDFKTKWNDDLLVINDYYQTERYPGPKYELPDKDEVEHSLKVAIEIFNTINDIITVSH